MSPPMVNPVCNPKISLIKVCNPKKGKSNWKKSIPGWLYPIKDERRRIMEPLI